MHDKAQLLNRVLVPLTNHYPQSGYTPKTLSALADDWCEDLADYALPEIELAARLARRKESFFPVTAKMLEYCEVARNMLTNENALQYRELPTHPNMNVLDRQTARERRAKIAKLMRRKIQKDPEDITLAADWHAFVARYGQLEARTETENMANEPACRVVQ